MQEHLEGRGSKFVTRYGILQLVYLEEYSLYADAIRRETNLKRWKRSWKIALIETHNPKWNDLLESWNKWSLDGRAGPAMEDELSQIEKQNLAGRV